MTCIAGITDGESVWIGCDSASSDGHRIEARNEEKIFRNGEFLFGFTSSWRMGQLLRWALDPPKHHSDVEIMKYLATDFIDAVRSCLKDGGWASKKDESESGGSFLIGYRGGLYIVHGDYQVGIPSSGYAAVGSGESFAMGAFAAMGDSGLPMRRRVLKALQAAQSHCTTVREPFRIEKEGG